jgi:two-component system sensor histidine kinase KdpD
MSRDLRRSDPDVLLARLKAEEETPRGKLRIWLAAAPGAGKTYAMLCEGHRRKSRGTDVVIGFVEPYDRTEIKEQLEGLEAVPPREIPYDGAIRLEMDTDAVLARHPKVALVDELAHTNLPGSKHEKRYQDVQELLDAGISVITTVNVESVESLSDYVEQITGIAVQETVPDNVFDEAQQVELIDLPPEVYIQRMKDGCIFPPEQAERALQTVFTQSNLTALRDLALRATAKEVEEKLDTYLHERKLEGRVIGERIMVAVDHGVAGKALIRRGWRLAAALKGEFIVVHVEPVEARRKPQSAEEEEKLKANLQFAEDLGAQVVQLRGRVSAELISYARSHHVSHLFIGHPSRTRWEEFFRGSVTNSILRRAPGISVHVIGNVNAPVAKKTASGNREEVRLRS